MIEYLSEVVGVQGGVSAQQLLVAVFEKNMYEPGKGGIVEPLAFVDLVVVHGRIVVFHHLCNKRMEGMRSLQDDGPLPVFPPGPSCHLYHQLKGPFVGSEIGIVHQSVGIQNTHYADVVKIETFGYHLGADQNLCFLLLELRDYLFVCFTSTSYVQVEATD